VKFARAVLGIAAVVFIPFGVWAFLDPVAIAGLTQVQLPTATALADGRAVYGGLTLGLGVFFALCAAHPAFVRPGLWALLLTVGGAFLGRLAGVIADGAGTTETYRTLIAEFTVAALAAVSLARGPSEQSSDSGEARAA
jgi:Domain of unknown function (DUF4345)